MSAIVQNVIDKRSGEKITRTVFDDGSHIDYFPSSEGSMINSYSLTFDKNQKIIEKIIYKADRLTVLEKIPGEKLQ